MEQPTFYAVITAPVRYEKRLSASEKLLYAEITALTNLYGKCFARNSYFAELYNVSNRTVSQWISNLSNCGFIKVKLIYKDNTKEVIKRYITLINAPTGENMLEVEKKISIPLGEKSLYPQEKNFQDNTTSINNIKNNIYTIEEQDLFQEDHSLPSASVSEVKSIQESSTEDDADSNTVSLSFGSSQVNSSAVNKDYANKPGKVNKYQDAINEIIDYYNSITHGKTKGSKEVITGIVQILKDGFTVEDIKLVTDYMQTDPHNNGCITISTVVKHTLFSGKLERATIWKAKCKQESEITHADGFLFIRSGE